MASEDEVLKLVANYFKYLDLPKGWGFAKQKNEAERKLRQYLKKHRITKKLVIRRNKTWGLSSGSGS